MAAGAGAGEDEEGCEGAGVVGWALGAGAGVGTLVCAWADGAASDVVAGVGGVTEAEARADADGVIAGTGAGFAGASESTDAVGADTRAEEAAGAACADEEELISEAVTAGMGGVGNRGPEEAAGFSFGRDVVTGIEDACAAEEGCV